MAVGPKRIAPAGRVRARSRASGCKASHFVGWRLLAVVAGVVANIAKGYVEKNVISLSGLTLERVGALPMPTLRTRTDLRRGYGALTLERLSGCAGCGIFPDTMTTATGSPPTSSTGCPKNMIPTLSRN